MIVTTALLLVVFTTVVFGSTVGLLSNCLFPKAKEVEEENEENKKELLADNE